jgi:hypothetical protein
VAGLDQHLTGGRGAGEALGEYPLVEVEDCQRITATRGESKVEAEDVPALGGETPVAE